MEVRKMRKVMVILGLMVFTGVAGTAAEQPLEIVRDGKSDFVIYCPADAPQSVQLARKELQEYIRKATGAELKAVDMPTQKMICLGDNPGAWRAGLLGRSITDEGFRIVTRGGNLYILGPDTPDGKHTSRGGFSRGTLNGVYTFLEKFLDIRWLLPGPDGEDVPRRSDLILGEVAISDAPDFECRHLPDIQAERLKVEAWQNIAPPQGGKPEVIRWKLRQKIGQSVHYWFSHSWYRVMEKHFDYEKHPDWFPMSSDGKRINVKGDRAVFCTTNPQAVEAFAGVIKDHFRAHPETYCYSISPSDVGDLCECPTCRALDETDPFGGRNVIKRILKFYNEVARSVGKEFPDRVLCGYIYWSYIYPPKDIKSVRVEKNLVPVIASSISYGYRLWRPDVQKKWTFIMDSWQKILPKFGYYDLPVRFEQTLGAPNPPGLKILKFLYPDVKNRGCPIIFMYGDPAWGCSAAQNYLLAKLAWNASMDIDAAFEEFCDRAYGKGGRDISKMFHLIDNAMEQYYIANDGYNYHLKDGQLRDVYAANFDAIERLYFTAKEKIRSTAAANRLDMLGQNLVIFHWNLRTRGFLKNPEASGFYRTDKAVKEFISKNKDSLALCLGGD